MSCAIEDCDKPASKAGMCWGHAKRKARGQTVSGPIKERPKSKSEWLREAALAYADADSDDEEAFTRAVDSLRKAAAAFGSATNERVGELTREALALLKSKGVKLGRPHRVSPEQAEQAIQKYGSVTKAAKRLRINRATLYRALLRKRPFLQHGT